MTKNQHDECVASIRKVCVEIGCSGMSKDCFDKPQNCDIIRNIFDKGKSYSPFEDTMEYHESFAGK